MISFIKKHKRELVIMSLLFLGVFLTSCLSYIRFSDDVADYFYGVPVSSLFKFVRGGGGKMAPF